jgi:hypothetical protein
LIRIIAAIAALEKLKKTAASLIRIIAAIAALEKLKNIGMTDSLDVHLFFTSFRYW